MRHGAVLYVLDLDRQRHFYEQCFSMRAESREPTWCRLVRDGWDLTLVEIPERVRASIELGEPPARRSETPIKLVFSVPSLAEVRATLEVLGGRVEDDIWEFDGVEHLDCIDLEGNVLQLREQP